ncbi:prephenate dehydrogenase, partial [Kitasatospora sp. NPDC056808]
VRIEHATGQQAGLVQLMVEPAAVGPLRLGLAERGWSLRA